MVNPGKQVGGELVHVRDCYVWAEIHYLDSPTDYREFLPPTSIRHTRVGSDLVMLDSCWDKGVWRNLLPFAWSLFVVLAVILLYLEL